MSNSGLLLAFQERMYDTADAYERTEQANTTASGEITREL